MAELSRAQRAKLERLQGLAADPDRAGELLRAAEQLHEGGLAWQDIAAAAGVTTTGLMDRVGKARRSGSRQRPRRNARVPAGEWRRPSTVELRRMRQLWRAVPRRPNGSYDWGSEAAQQLSSAAALVEDGIPIFWLSSGCRIFVVTAQAPRCCGTGSAPPWAGLRTVAG